MKKNNDAIKLSKLINSKDTIRNTINILLNSLGDIHEESLNKIAEIFSRKENMEKMLNEVADLYSKHYTASEIKSLVKFYSSKVGRKHQEVTLRTLSETGLIGHDWGKRVITDNLDEIKSVLEGMDSDIMEANGIDKPLQNRLGFAREYAKGKGWDVTNLTAEQILEIRNQDGWKNLNGEKS